jgi:hypothetical protein
VQEETLSATDGIIKHIQNAETLNFVSRNFTVGKEVRKLYYTETEFQR